LKVVRVVNLWQAHQIFADEVIEPILNKCQASGLGFDFIYFLNFSYNLDVEPAKVERLVKGLLFLFNFFSATLIPVNLNFKKISV